MKKKDYMKIISDTQIDVCNELVELLGKKGPISIEDGNLDFFDFSLPIELEITDINENGIITSGYQEGNPISSLVDSATLPLLDVIALVNELRILKN